MHCAPSCQTKLCIAMQTGFHAEPAAGSAQLLCMLLTVKAKHRHSHEWPCSCMCLQPAASECHGLCACSSHAFLGASTPHKCIAAVESSAGTRNSGQGTCHRCSSTWLHLTYHLAHKGRGFERRPEADGALIVAPWPCLDIMVSDQLVVINGHVWGGPQCIMHFLQAFLTGEI